jgi:hypothetical protein
MKKLTFSFLASAALAASAFAGHEAISTKEYKAPMPEPCFRDNEFQLDIFGSYSGEEDNGDIGDGFGGGVGVNYFFTRNFGIALSGNVYDGTHNGIWHTDLDVVIRFPIENGICIAPYIQGGGGILTDGTTVGTWNAGAGLEWRATPTFGIFGEGRYIWGANGDTDTAQARVGLRFVF